MEINLESIAALRENLSQFREQIAKDLDEQLQQNFSQNPPLSHSSRIHQPNVKIITPKFDGDKRTHPM